MPRYADPDDAASYRAALLAEQRARYDQEIAAGWRVPIYRGYHITVGPGYTPDSRWEFVHDDYDGPGDRRCGCAKSPDDCRAEIDEIEDRR